MRNKKLENVNEEDLSVKDRQDEEHHPMNTIENVLVGIDNFNFPIDLLTLGIEENQQVSSSGKSSKSKSQAWIDTDNGEMTLLVGQEKVKINLTQSIQLTDEEKLICMLIESSFPHFEEQALEILQEDTLEGIKWKTYSVPTVELAFEHQFIILKVENLISTTDEDDGD